MECMVVGLLGLVGLLGFRVPCIVASKYLYRRVLGFYIRIRFTV